MPKVRFFSPNTNDLTKSQNGSISPKTVLIFPKNFFKSLSFSLSLSLSLNFFISIKKSQILFFFLLSIFPFSLVFLFNFQGLLITIHIVRYLVTLTYKHYIVCSVPISCAITLPNIELDLMSYFPSWGVD